MRFIHYVLDEIYQWILLSIYLSIVGWYFFLHMKAKLKI
jgi:hypothetical protein